MKLLFVLLATVGVTAFGQSFGPRLAEIADEAEKQNTLRLQRVASYLQSQPGARLEVSESLFLYDVSPSGMPVYRTTLNVGAAQTTGASALQNPTLSGLQLEGEGMTIHVWDDGLVKQHIEFGTRLIATQGTTLKDHATHVTGTLIASGANPQAKGMAPKANASTYFFGIDDAVMAQLAASDESSILFSNHSYGTATGWQRMGNGWQWMGDLKISSEEDYRFGFYTEQARRLDEITYHAPYYSIFWAAGNDRADSGDGTRPRDCNAGTGYDCIIPDAVAKNIFTIGAVNKVSAYLSPSSVVMDDYSSWGPTDDGRIKPDLVGAGTNLFSTSASGDNSYTVLGGTSMATPNVAGSLLLVQELHKKLNGGRPMTSASLKALAVHTAREAGPFPGPDYGHGWGLLDVQAAAQHLLQEDGQTSRLEEWTLSQGKAIELPISVAANSKVVVTIAWTDPAGTPLAPALDRAVPMLVNDLDIRLVADDGAQQQPWVLDPLNPSRQAFRGDNFRDNVEKLDFTSAASKSYKIRITHKGQLTHGKQNFSLVLSYTAANQPTIFYWVGGSGVWSDPNHWALKTGAIPAQKIPTATDVAVVDENSFSSNDGLISLNGDASIARFKWIGSRPAKLNLAEHTLSIGRELSVASKFTVFENGTIELHAIDSGVVNWQAPERQPIILEFSSGKWRYRGNMNAASLQLTGGELVAKNTELMLGDFAAVALSPARLNLEGSIVEIGSSFKLSPLVELNTRGTTLRTMGTNTLIDWSDIAWQGSVTIANGVTRLVGEHTIQRMDVHSKVVWAGATSIDSLQVFGLSELTWEQPQPLHVKYVHVNASAAEPAFFRGPAGSALVFDERRKFCFNYINVQGVSVAGEAIVNAGEQSSLSSAPGWLQLNCDRVLFADFDVQYACEGGIAKLTNASGGAFTKGIWTLLDAEQVSVSDRQEWLVDLPNTKARQVRLRIEGTDGANEVVKTIQPRSNPLPTNEVVRNGEQLLSFRQADAFQWFKNNEPITGATERVFQLGDAEGVFAVAIFDDGCSRVSSPYLITGMGKEQTPLRLIPNPASGNVQWVGEETPDRIILVNMWGQQAEVELSGNQFSVDSFAAGLYVVRAHTTAGWLTSRLVIAR